MTAYDPADVVGIVEENGTPGMNNSTEYLIVRLIISYNGVTVYWQPCDRDHLDE